MSEISDISVLTSGEERETDRQTDRQTETERDRHRQTDRDRDRETETETERDRQRERDKEREMGVAEGRGRERDDYDCRVYNLTPTHSLLIARDSKTRQPTSTSAATGDSEAHRDWTSGADQD